MLAQGGCGTGLVQRSPSPVIHVLDTSVWVSPRPIDWPGQDHTVLVYFGVDESVSICGRRLKTEAQRKFGAESGLLLGRACGHLVVLFAPYPPLTDHTLRRMAAAHEAFHIAVQAHSLLPRIDVVSTPADPGEAELASINALASDLVALLRRDDTPTRDVCKRLKTGYEALEPTGRSYFSYKSYWEWPAEFYMRETVLGDNSFTDYVAEHRKLTHGATEPIYIAGALAMEWIERRIARAEWQRRYVQGETILNLFAQSISCPPLHRPTLQVDSFTWEDIFTDVAP